MVYSYTRTRCIVKKSETDCIKLIIDTLTTKDFSLLESSSVG